MSGPAANTIPVHEGEPELGDALTERLDQLRDETWMKPVLARALEVLTGSAVTVDGYDIDYCKIKPRRDINVAVEVRYRREDEAGPITSGFSCTVFPSAERARRKFADERARMAPEGVLRRLDAGGFREHSVLLDEPPLIVRAFPLDPVLRGLDAATGFHRLALLLAGQIPPGPDGRPRVPRAIRYDVLHYKPLRTCTLHYDVELADERGGPADHWHAYGKVYRDERGDRCHELLGAAWEASCASGGLWRAARPLGLVPEWRLVLQEAVPGHQFRHVFGELTGDDCTSAELETARRHLRSIARAVRSMQERAAPIGPVADFDALLASQDSNLAYLGRSHPDLAAKIAAVRRRLVEVAERTAAGPLVFAHGDFAHGNVLIDGGQVGLIDFDRACRAEPAYDVAYFLTHMWSFGVRHPKREGHVRPLCDFFRRCYLELAPEVCPRRMALYEALDFSAYVLRNFRKQSHQESWQGWAHLQIEAAWQRLAVAEGGGRGMRLGYLLKCFPRVSETFILNEVLELERQGLDMRVYSMISPTESTRHALVDEVRTPIAYMPYPYLPALHRYLAAHAQLFLRHPWRYLIVLLDVLISFDRDLLERFLQAGCLARLLRRDGIDHVHAGFVHSPGSVAWIVHRITGLPFSLATHAKDMYHSPARLLRRKLAASRLVFTCTGYNVSTLRALGPQARVRHIYHGTHLERFAYRTEVGSEPAVILAVGRLVEKKGLEHLIEACAIMRGRGRAFQCHIIGSGPLREALQARIDAAGLHEVATLHGAQPQEVVGAWYRRATVFALPCLITADGDRDGIPNVLVEAAACGVPLVSTPVSGIPELVRHRHTGLAVPPRDPQALAAAIEELLDSPALREELRARARALVEDQFDVTRNARAIARELREVMGEETRDERSCAAPVPCPEGARS